MNYAVGQATVMKDVGVALPPLRSLAIVGSHPDSRENAPFDNPDYEILLFNEAPQKPEIYRRWDTCLQIHKPEVYTSETNWVNKDHWAWLQQDHGPDKRIFMQEADPRVPNSVRYPIEGIRELVPYKYLKSSPAMALALAIYLGYKNISLYGSDLSSNTEYHYQAINYAFWIGFAHGRGVNLDMQCWRSEFYQPIYGYEGELQLDRDHFISMYEEHQKVYKMKNKGLEKFKDRIKTAMLNSKYDKVGELSLGIETSAIATGESFGAMSEAKRYAERTDHISRQEFERVSAQAQLDGEAVEKLMNHEAGKCEYVWNVWQQTGRLEALEQLRMFMDQRTKYAFDMGKQLGIFRENIAFMNEYDARITAAGGPRAVTQALGGKS